MTTESALKATGLPQRLVDAVTDTSRASLNKMTEMAVDRKDSAAAARYINAVDSDGNHGLQALVKEAKVSPQTPQGYEDIDHKAARLIYLGGTVDAADPAGEQAQAQCQFRKEESKLLAEFKLAHPGTDPYRDKDFSQRIAKIRAPCLEVIQRYRPAGIEAVSSGHTQWPVMRGLRLQNAIRYADMNRTEILNNESPSIWGW
jgi:hypothetical protein